MKKICHYYLIVLLLQGCSKDPMIINTPKIGELELSWQTALREDNQYSPTANNPPIILNDDIAFFYDAVEEQEKILFVSKIDHTVNRFFNQIQGNIKQSFFHQGVGLLAIDYENIFVGSNADAMKILSTVPENLSFGANNNLVGDYLYMDDRNENTRTNYIYQVNVNSGELNYYEIIRDDQYSDYDKVSILTPYDCIIGADTFFINNILKLKKNFGKFDVININKSTKETLWTKTNQKQGYSEFINYNNTMICSGGDSLYCLKPLTGEKVWATPYIFTRDWKGWVPKNMLLVGDKLTLLDQGHYVEINAKNGNILYDSPELFLAQTNSKINYFEGVFYWTAAGTDAYSYLFGLRASDKKMVVKMKSPNAAKFNNETNFDWNGIQIDPETRLGYTTDGFYAMCFKIPENY